MRKLIRKSILFYICLFLGILSTIGTIADVIIPCPGQCCQGDSRYVDRPCPEGKYCNVNMQTCSSSLPDYYPESGDNTETIILIVVIALGIIIAVVIWAFSRKKSEESREGGFCKKCGEKLSENSDYCKKCGTRQ